MIDRRLLVALGLSLLLHASVVSSPGWRLPFWDEPEAVGLIEARIGPRRAAQPAPERSTASPAAKPARQPPRAAPALPAASPPSQAEPAMAEPATPPVSPAVAAPIAVPARRDVPWPGQGRIRFLVTRGEGEPPMQVGESTHAWRHDGEKYLLHTVTETTGLVALFRQVKIVQSSEGEVDGERIVPREFRVERNGRQAEGARFDWAGMKVTLLAGGQPRRETALASGAQDLLSQIYQVGLAGAAARLELMIATGNNYGRYAYEAVGEERIATRFGELRTWHVKTPALPGEQATELWLASDYRNLPVRIRFLDRKGDVFEQNAVEIEIDGVRLAERNE